MRIWRGNRFARKFSNSVLGTGDNLGNVVHILPHLAVRTFFIFIYLSKQWISDMVMKIRLFEEFLLNNLNFFFQSYSMSELSQLNFQCEFQLVQLVKSLIVV